MRIRVLFVSISAIWICGIGCQNNHQDAIVSNEPVKIPPSRILTLSEAQLVSLDWHSPDIPGARVKSKRIIAGPGVEFDIYFPSNSSHDSYLNFVSSGEGGIGALLGSDIRGYKDFALKIILVSINGQSGPAINQQIVAGAIIGPTSTGQLSTYEPITLGLASSEKTAIAKTPITTDNIFKIGFHVHMLNPQEWDPSGSTMTLRIEPVEDGGTVL